MFESLRIGTKNGLFLKQLLLGVLEILLTTWLLLVLCFIFYPEVLFVL